MVRDVVVDTVVVAEAVVDAEVLATVVTETQTDSLIEDLEITRGEMDSPPISVAIHFLSFTLLFLSAAEFHHFSHTYSFFPFY